MGREYEGIDEHLRRWIERQRVFFVGTAPLAADGRVNISPKGPIDTLRVLGPRRLAYLDLVGSGVETLAHLRENGRIVVMLCAFEGPPRIVRLHGRGEVVRPRDPRFEALADTCRFGPVRPQLKRAIVDVVLERVSDSCGYGVPLLSYEGERPHQDAWAAKKLRVGGPDALLDYQARKNAVSIDGLPGVELPR